MKIFFCLFLLFAVKMGWGQTYTLFVGTYTNSGSNTDSPPKDSTGSKGIYVYRWDAGTGRATLLSHTEGVVNPSYLAPGPGGKILYAVTETRTLHAGSLSTFAFDRGSGALRLLGKVSSGGDNPVYVSVHPGGKWIAVANYTGGSLSVFPIRADGSPEVFAVRVQHFGKSVDTIRQDRPHIHSAVYSPDGRYLYVQDLGLDKIMIYPFTEGSRHPLGLGGMPVASEVTANLSGELEEPSRKPGLQVSTVPGGGPRHLVFAPNGKYAYLVEEMGGSVDVYRYHPESGALDSLQRIPAHAAGVKGPFRSADIHVSADGRYLYASNREAESNIAIFSIDTTTGMLKTVGYQSVFGKEPRNFTLDPSGRWLLVANQESNQIVIYRVDRETGLLRPTGRRTASGSPDSKKSWGWARGPEVIPVPAPTCLKMAP